MRRAFAFLILVGCAPISEDACRVGDWDGLGFKDGTKGRPASVLGSYIEACGDYGIAPRRDMYLAARQRGLRLYCTPDNAYDLGRDGDSLNAVCTAEEAAAMRGPHRQGMRIWDVEQEINRVRSDLRGISDALDQLGASDKDKAKRSRLRRQRGDLRLDLQLLELRLLSLGG